MRASSSDRVRSVRVPFVLTFALLTLAARAQINPLDSIISNLSGKVLPSGWMENHTPHGTLHDHGIALWEMPPTYQGASGLMPVEGGGYNNHVRRLQVDSTFYHWLFKPGHAGAALSQSDLDQIWQVVFGSPFSAMSLSDFSSLYNAGTSVALQNLVFAPIKIGSTFSHWTYPEVPSILAAATAQGLAVHADIGFANNWAFPANEWEFAMRYGLLRKGPDVITTEYFDPDKMAIAGVSPNTFLNIINFPGMLGVGKPHGSPMLDFAHPSVLPVGLASITGTVQSFGTAIKYYVAGEYFTFFPPDVSTDPCIASLPTTGWSDHALAGFKSYMQNLVGTIEALNARWGLAPGTIPDFPSITYEDHVKCDFSAQAVKDFLAFQQFLAEELLLLQYRTAKEALAAATCGKWSGGEAGTERSWLESDFGASMDWYHDEPGYFAPFGNFLRTISAATHLSGTPTTFGVTCPPPDAAMTQAGCELSPPIGPPAYKPKCVSTELFRLTLRDTFTAGAVNHGYVKAPGNYAFYNSTTLPLFTAFLAQVKSWRANLLRFMTPYARIVLHLDASKMGGFDSAAVTGWLVDTFEKEQYPYALCSDQRTLSRLFASQREGRSVVLSVFHNRLAAQSGALLTTYLQIANQTNPQPAVFVMTDTATAQLLLPYLPPTIIVTPLQGVTLIQWASNLNYYLLVFPDSTLSTNQATLTMLLPQMLHALSADPTQPFLITSSTAGTDLRSSLVSDGLNFYMAVSNYNKTTSYLNVTVTPHTELVGHFQGAVSGYTMTGGSGSLGPRGTDFVYAKAIVPGLSLVTPAQFQAKILAYNNLLTSLAGNGYDTSHGTTAISYISAINKTAYPERALAGLIRLKNSLFLNVTRTGATLSIDAKHLDGTLAVGAYVRVIHLLDGHAEQDGGVTDAAGHRTVTIGPAVNPRYDFMTQTIGVPGNIDPATEPVEVHVHERATGAETFVTR